MLSSKKWVSILAVGKDFTTSARNFLPVAEQGLVSTEPQRSAVAGSRILTWARAKHLGVRWQQPPPFFPHIYRMNLRRKAVAAATRTPRSVSLVLKFLVLGDS